MGCRGSSWAAEVIIDCDLWPSLTAMDGHHRLQRCIIIDCGEGSSLTTEDGHIRLPRRVTAVLY